MTRISLVVLPLPFGLTTLSVNGEPLRKNEEEWLTSGSPPWYIQDKYKPEQRELLVSVQVSLKQYRKCGFTKSHYRK